MSKAQDPQIKLRLPADLKQWVDQQAYKNRSSKSSEIVRSVRERQERLALAQAVEPAQAPVAPAHTP